MNVNVTLQMNSGRLLCVDKFARILVYVCLGERVSKESFVSSAM